MTSAGALLPIAGLSLMLVPAVGPPTPARVERLSTRGTFVVAHLALQALVLAITEVLNLGRHIDRRSVVVAWLVVEPRSRPRGRQHGRSRWSAIPARRSSPVTTSVDTSAGRPPEVFVGVAHHRVDRGGAGRRRLDLPAQQHGLARLSPARGWPTGSRSRRSTTSPRTGRARSSWRHCTSSTCCTSTSTGSDRLDGFVQLVAFVVCVVGRIGDRPTPRRPRPTSGRRRGHRRGHPVGDPRGDQHPEQPLRRRHRRGHVRVVLAWIPWGGGSCRRSPRARRRSRRHGQGHRAGADRPGVVLLTSRLVVLLSDGLIVARSSGRHGRRASVVVVCAVLMAGPFLKRNHDVFGAVHRTDHGDHGQRGAPRPRGRRQRHPQRGDATSASATARAASTHSSARSRSARSRPSTTCWAFLRTTSTSTSRPSPMPSRR